MLDAFLGQLQICIGQSGDTFDTVDAIDEWNDAEHGQIPVLVDHGVNQDRKQWNVPWFDTGRIGECREEFDIQRVKLIDGNHAFAVIIEVFHQHFA